MDGKEELQKGSLDESSPPGSPTDLLGGKSDANGTTFTVSLESAHPYTNNLNRSYSVDLDGIVPSCTRQVRGHFAALRTEAGYDFLSVVDPAGVEIQSIDGRHDGTWSEWVTVNEADKRFNLKLETDYSVTDYGFRVDAVEVQTVFMCPRPPELMCEGYQFDVTPIPGVCACRGPTRCLDQSEIVIEHNVGGGFTGQVTGHRLSGRDGLTVKYLPGQPDETAIVGRVSLEAAQELVHAVLASGILGRADVIESSNWNESFTITWDGVTHTFVKPQGSFSAADQALIAQFEALFGCDGLNAPLTCGDGFGCVEDACVEEASCFCPANYDPVCGADGRTYSNGCAAGCAGAGVSHDGECGIAGDFCGGLMGLTCQDDFKCRYDVSTYEYPFPDAGGRCVAATYCDAPADCAGLPHIAVPGVWGCDANSCAWHAGPAWIAATGSTFETAHPYANNLATWKQVYLPAGATKMRLVKTGTFDLETNYDYLEVWAWRNAAWTRVKRYTGTVGPALTEEFAGQYFQLKLVTDSSVTKHGFKVAAEYGN